MVKAMTLQQVAEPVEDDLHLFPLERLLPRGRAICVNTTQLIISYVSTEIARGNPIHLQRSLTDLHMRLLLALFTSPRYCPHEVLYASLFCPYEVLLAGLFSSERVAREDWLAVVQQYRHRLRSAREHGTWRKALKRLYNLLSELRAILRPFGLGIALSSLDSAYMLTALAHSTEVNANHANGTFSPTVTVSRTSLR